MRRSQLAINCPAPLLERLRAEAQRQQTTATSLVVAWLEAGLDGRLDAPRSEAAAPASSELEARLDAVEQQLDELKAALAQRPAPRPPRVPKAQAKPEADQGPGAEPLPPIDAPEGALTTVELAKATSTSKGGWNNWAKPERVGEVRHHPRAGSWRLLGKVAPPAGGPEPWLWERVG